jgi:hypothetical protein
MPTFVAFNSIENECVYIRQIGNKLQFFFLHAMKNRRRQWEENRKKGKEKKNILNFAVSQSWVIDFQFLSFNIEWTFFFISIPFLLQFSRNVCAMTYCVLWMIETRIASPGLALAQWYSNYAPRHTSVAPKNLRCVVKNLASQ